MKCSLSKSELSAFTAQQINHFFPDPRPIISETLAQYLDETLERLGFCFSHIERKYYAENGEPLFDHLNSDHYAMFLYLLSNTVYENSKDDEQLAAKIFLLNKALHGLDVFYKVKLPDIFMFVHPVGTIVGNGKYEDYFVIYQNCSVGSNEQGEYPTFGEGVVMYSGSSVIGSCSVGGNVVLAANAFLVDTNVTDDQIVVGAYPDHRFKPNHKSVVERIFKA